MHGYMQENYTIHYWSERHIPIPWEAFYDGSISYCRPQLVSHSTPTPFLAYTHFSGHYCHLHHDLVLCMHWYCWFYMSIFCYLHNIIGVRNRGWGEARAPPQYFTLETLLIFIHAVEIAVITVYITFDPPKMELLPTPMQHIKNI